MNSFLYPHYDFTLSKVYEKDLHNGQSALPLIPLFWVQTLSDGGDVRDFIIYNVFQESREQLGKILSFLYSSEDGEDYTPLL